VPAADVAGEVVGALVGEVVGSTEVEVRVDVDVTALVRDVGGWFDVEGWSDVGAWSDVAAVVRGGRVGAVAVTLGSSDTLGAVRVPERSVEGRVAESLPPPAPQPLSQRTRPSTSPARNHALPARATGRDVGQDVRIDDLLRIDRAGGGARRPFFGPGPPAASPEADENAVPSTAWLLGRVLAIRLQEWFGPFTPSAAGP
jgi:hypothetical protein